MARGRGSWCTVVYTWTFGFNCGANIVGAAAGGGWASGAAGDDSAVAEARLRVSSTQAGRLGVWVDRWREAVPGCGL